MKLIEEINQIIREAHVLIACLLASANMLCAQEQDKSITVETIGIGADAVSAEKNAIYQAVQQAVGAYVDQETKIKNDELIHDKILSVAQGFVESYQVLEQAKKRKDGSELWDVKIKAVVKKTEVGAALRAQGVMQVHADGTSAWAEMITKTKNRDDGMALLQKFIPEIRKNLICGRIVQNSGKVETIDDPKTGKILALIQIEYDVNIEWWKKEALPVLDAALTAMSLQSKPCEAEEVFVRSGEKSNLLTFKGSSESTYGYNTKCITLLNPVNQQMTKWLIKKYFLPEEYLTQLNNLSEKYNYHYQSEYFSKSINEFEVEFCASDGESIHNDVLQSDAEPDENYPRKIILEEEHNTKNAWQLGFHYSVLQIHNWPAINAQYNIVSRCPNFKRNYPFVPYFHRCGLGENDDVNVQISKNPIVKNFLLNVPNDVIKKTNSIKLHAKCYGVKSN